MRKSRGCCPTSLFPGAISQGPKDPRLAIPGLGTPPSHPCVPPPSEDRPPDLAPVLQCPGLLRLSLPRLPCPCAPSLGCTAPLCSPGPECPLSHGRSQSSSAPSPDNPLPLGSTPPPISQEGRGLPGAGMCHIQGVQSEAHHKTDLKPRAIAPHRTLQKRDPGLRRVEGEDPGAEVGCVEALVLPNAVMSKDVVAPCSLGRAGSEPSV